ncbi:MAG: protein translocase subunit SecF [Defluviitaleaceae bacterium]|nr:protein translocase subunit SecF [Defluviitaleaceae bacterium]
MRTESFKIVQKFKYCISFSLLLMLAGIAAMIINSARGQGAFFYDVEFSGGTSFDVNIGAEFNNNDIVDIVRQITNQQTPEVQKVGNGTEVSIKMHSLDSATRTALSQAIIDKYGITADEINYSDFTATVSAQILSNAIWAVVAACLLMMLYVAIRFRDLKIGASAILALLHDAFIVVAFYAILRIPLNYSFIAAVLTVLGYSTISTIVIFDRIRENRPLMRKSTHVEIANRSVTQTLRRSIFTSITVFVSILFVYILGVDSIRQFTLPLEIGVVFGLYSSVMISASLWCMMNRKQDVKIQAVAAKAAQQAAEKEAQAAKKAVQAEKTEQTAKQPGNVKKGQGGGLVNVNANKDGAKKKGKKY